MICEKKLDASENMVCFYHEYEENGCFSNWYYAEFDYAGTHFTSTEQFMMYHKVLMFRQYDLAEQILKCSDQGEIKKLGRTRFAGFNRDLWERTCRTVVKRGIRAKFEQNFDILKLLLDTEDRLIAECSRNDTKWGIGVDIDEPDRFYVSRWNGKNYLGRILMEVRDELRTVSRIGRLGYVDVRDKAFPQWEKTAGHLRRYDKYYHALSAYSDTLRGKEERDSFYFNATLSEWEEAMRYNMGGGLPAIGFYEMKQELYDIARLF